MVMLPAAATIDMRYDIDMIKVTVRTSSDCGLEKHVNVSFDIRTTQSGGRTSWLTAFGNNSPEKCECPFLSLTSLCNARLPNMFWFIRLSKQKYRKHLRISLC